MKTAPNAGRADPFGDLTDFIPTTPRKAKPELEAIHRILNEDPLLRHASAREDGNISKKNKKRQHYRTGRNLQFNMRASADTIERFHRIANSQSWVLGETLEYALDALEEKLYNC